MTVSEQQQQAGSQAVQDRPPSEDTALYADLAVQLRAIANQASDAAHFRQATMELLCTRASSIAVAWCRLVDDQTQFLEHNLTGPVFERADVRQWIGEHVAACRRKGCSMTADSPLIRNLRLHSQPIRTGDDAGGDTVLVMLVTSSQSANTNVLVAELVAATSSMRSLLKETSQANSEVNQLATLVDLSTSAGESTSTAQFAKRVAKDLCRSTQCEMAAVGRTTGESGQVKVISLSGHKDFDARATATELVCAVMEEAVARNAVTCWPPAEDRDHFLSIAHRKLAGAGFAAVVMSVPLQDRNQRPVGAIVVLGQRSMATPVNLGLLDALSTPIGCQLQAILRREGGLVRRACRTLLRFAASMKMVVLLALVLLLIAGMFVPVPFHVWCQSEMHPPLRRYSVAPFDGLLETTLVEPGDIVSAGELLATLDGREIRWELSGTTADRQKAERERDAYLAEYRMPEAVISGLEMERKQHELNVLEFRESQLEVRSPIAGVILDGSLDRRENYPVNAGDVIYEIAPLSPLRAEVQIEAEDRTHIQPGMQVQLFINGMEGEPVDSEIVRIRPRSEVIDNNNVFVAEVLIDNAQNRIRPGMTASVRIRAGKEELWWVLFHKVIERLSTALRW